MKITVRELKKIIRESVVEEMAAEAEPFNADKLADAASRGYDELKAAAVEWVENIWGLGKAMDDKKMLDYARKVNKALQILKPEYVPAFRKSK